MKIGVKMKPNIPSNKNKAKPSEIRYSHESQRINEDIHKMWSQQTEIVCEIIRSKILDKNEAKILLDIFINNIAGYYGGDMRYSDMLENKIILLINKTYNTRIKTNAEIGESTELKDYRLIFTPNGMYMKRKRYNTQAGSKPDPKVRKRKWWRI